MKNLHGTRFLLLLLCSLSFVCALSQNTPLTTLRTEITLLNQRLEEAFNKNDMPKVAAFYADDAEIVYDNGFVVKGRKNLDSYWSNLKDMGRGWKLTIVDIGGGGEFVYQLGKSDLKYLVQGKETRSVTNFVLLWRKQADGTYKIFRDYLTNTVFTKPG